MTRSQTPSKQIPTARVPVEIADFPGEDHLQVVRHIISALRNRGLRVGVMSDQRKATVMMAMSQVDRRYTEDD